MKPDTEIIMLTVTADLMGKQESVHPVLIRLEGKYMLVDTAYPGQWPLLRQALAEASVTPQEISRVLITHQDLDHIGCLPALLEELAVAGRPLVVATALEKPYIEGSRRLLKLTPEAVEQAVSRLPPSIPSAWRDAFRRTLEHPPTANVDCCIDSAEERPYEGGLMIVPTPGHTPGHISLYHSASRTLIAADALRIEDGLLLPPAPELCSDYEEALRSIERLRLMDIARIICFHGGLYEKGDIRERLEELPVLA